MATPLDGTPPPPPPAAYGYPPSASPAAPVAAGPKLSERFSPESIAARGPWNFLALLAQGLGLILLFVGTLVVVVFGSYPADCFTSTCAYGSLDQGIAYGIETARLLWTLGLFGIAAGAGIRLQFTTPNPAPTTPEGTRMYLARRRGEFVILVIAIVLLFLLLLFSTGSFVTAPTPP